MLKKRSISLIALSVFVSSLLITPNAGSQVVCTNCGTEVTQLLNNVQMVQQVVTSAKQLQAELSMYADMVTNSKGVTNQLWGNAMADFNRLRGLMSQSKSLAFSSGNLDGQFAAKYGTYDTYLAKNMKTADWEAKYQQWSEDASDNTLYALKGLNLQSNQLQDDQALMQRLQTMAATSDGRMQALQVANMIAAENVAQLQKLRQLMMLQAQLQANYLAQQQDQAAARKAASRNFIRPYNATMSGTYF